MTPAERRNRRAFGPQWIGRAYLLAGLALLVLLPLGLVVGARQIPLAEVARALLAYDPGNDAHLVLRELRLPRTALALVAGASLGLAGALMQTATRNPLAEPGLLGINAGAAMAVVLGASVLGLTRVGDYIWLGFLGAGLAGAAVFALGRAHETGTDPVRLVLAGAGISVLLGAATGLIILNAQLDVLDVFRNWGAGNLEGRGGTAVMVTGGALILSLLVALPLAPALNALALGQEAGRSLGLSPARIWLLVGFVVMLLSGAATASAGPIGFVGLVAPHLARALAGPDHRHLLPLSALFAAAILLSADIIGRVIARPEDIAAGIIAALIGGPFFIHTVRRFRLARL